MGTRCDCLWVAKENQRSKSKRCTGIIPTTIMGVRLLEKLLDAEALTWSSQGSSDADMKIVLNKSKSLRNFQGDVQ